MTIREFRVSFCDIFVEAKEDPFRGGTSISAIPRKVVWFTKVGFGIRGRSKMGLLGQMLHLLFSSYIPTETYLNSCFLINYFA